MPTLPRAPKLFNCPATALSARPRFPGVPQEVTSRRWRGARALPAAAPAGVGRSSPVVLGSPPSVGWLARCAEEARADGLEWSHI